MPRNGTGTYSLPQPPFVSGTVISSAAVNSDFSDIATALTGSLPRDGQAGMTGQFKASDGSLIAPAISFSNEINTGFYRPAANQLGVIINGIQVGLFTANGLSGGAPIGAVLDYSGITAPAGFLLPYGQAISRVTYAAYFSIVGTTYGSGDGVTTFNMPDLRGRSIAGLDNMGGVSAGRLSASFTSTSPGNSGGEATHLLVGAEMPVHTHDVNITSATENANHNHLYTVPTTKTATAVVTNGLPSSIFWSGTDATITQFEGQTHQHTVNGTSTVSGGGGVHNNVQPTMVMNKIIYVGV